MHSDKATLAGIFAIPLWAITVLLTYSAGLPTASQMVPFYALIWQEPCKNDERGPEIVGVLGFTGISVLVLRGRAGSVGFFTGAYSGAARCHRMGRVLRHQPR